ncbi:MAG: type 1 glutamine amidotransferase [Halioglobus sp.]|jgi:type 1 glutamine amidotransferase
MNHCLSITVSLFLSCYLSTSTAVSAALPVKALLLTSPGVYHNYEHQTQLLTQGISQHANVHFDISVAQLQRWETTDYSEGYDVLIYNICMADNTNSALIENMRRQTEALGVPALFLHCAMHSFRTTDKWWPLFGLQTKAHEHLRSLPQTKATKHPVLGGIGKDWTVAKDELYINLAMDAQPLLTSTGGDKQEHTTTWLKQIDGTTVFGTTLGHTDETLQDPSFQRLIGNALLYVTHHLTPSGEPEPAYAATAGANTVIGEISNGEGAGFLGEEGKDCVNMLFVGAIGPCYAGCTLNPLHWGEETQACKDLCVTKLPSSDEAIAACSSS